MATFADFHILAWLPSALAPEWRLVLDVDLAICCVGVANKRGFVFMNLLPRIPLFFFFHVLASLGGNLGWPASYHGVGSGGGINGGPINDTPHGQRWLATEINECNPISDELCYVL